MAETQAPPKPVESARRMFRNTSTVRKFYLRPRVGSKHDFILLPGQSVVAMDADEEALLEQLGEIVDVAKDAPAVANSMAALNKQLDEERKKNSELEAVNKDLQAKVKKANR